MIVAATLSQVLAQNYILEFFSFCFKSLILATVGYVSVQIFSSKK